jgi:phosphoribosylglycinamide formyltransferase-1
VKRVVVLISGQGRNLQALIDAQQRGILGAVIVAVIANRADAQGLQRASAANIPTEVVPHSAFSARAAFDDALAQAIERHRPDFIAMAGFMRVVGDAFIQRFRGRLLNIHPSLLPKYPGMRTHQRALEAGDAEHGATVHFVTEELDGGPAIIQGRLSVHAQDTVETLAERVMQEVECKIYPQAVAWLARGQVVWGQTHANPRELHDLEPEFR